MSLALKGVCNRVIGIVRVASFYESESSSRPLHDIWYWHWVYKDWYFCKLQAEPNIESWDLTDA